MIHRAVFGAPGAHRRVVVIEEGRAAPSDPHPAVTASHRVSVLSVRIADAAEDTQAERDVLASTRAVMREFLDADESFGLVGIGTGGGRLAIALADALADRVDALVLIGVERPEGLTADLERDELAAVRAAGLVIDTDERADAARWHADALSRSSDSSGARVSLVLGRDGRVSLRDVWDEVVGHVAAPTTAT